MRTTSTTAATQKRGGIGDTVVYVDNEGIEYAARILNLNADEAAELYVTGERGDWTVIDVPHAATMPQTAQPGAYWKYETYYEIPAPAPIVTDDQLVASKSKKRKQVTK